jgi:hypothetical protein
VLASTATAASARLRTAAHLVARARRRTGIPARRLAACGAVAATALALRGTTGVLLGIFAVMLVVDAVVPIPGVTRSEADERFGRLVRQRRRAQRARRLRGLAPQRLDVLDDGVGWVARAERRPVGVRSIPIASITGTAEETKARAFDRRFRPERASCEHWKRLWVAQARGAPLPPISVYRVGADHVVRDGHHRISVALDHGLTAIDADVVELSR